MRHMKTVMIALRSRLGNPGSMQVLQRGHHQHRPAPASFHTTVWKSAHTKGLTNLK